MINSIEVFFDELNKKALDKKLKLAILEDDSLSIKSFELNNLLKVVFDLCSENKICFNIIKEEYDFLKLELLFSLDIKTIFIKVKYEQKIIKEQLKHKESIERYKKLKIFPIVGPDGVGKTTLLTSALDINKKEIVYKRFKKIVRRSVLYNILYPLNRYLLKKKLGRKPEKDQYDDIHYLLVLIAGIIYYPYLIFISKFKNKTVFLDRFFNDYLLENISFLDKKTILRENWKTLLLFIPRVYWKVHLDAKAEVILTRKDELTKEDIEAYRNYNFEIYLEKPSFVYTYINTGLEIEKCKFFFNHTLNNVMESK